MADNITKGKLDQVKGKALIHYSRPFIQAAIESFDNRCHDCPYF
jgi:hypothetical protein